MMADRTVSARRSSLDTPPPEQHIQRRGCGPDAGSGGHPRISEVIPGAQPSRRTSAVALPRLDDSTGGRCGSPPPGAQGCSGVTGASALAGETHEHVSGLEGGGAFPGVVWRGPLALRRKRAKRCAKPGGKLGVLLVPLYVGPTFVAAPGAAQAARPSARCPAVVGPWARPGQVSEYELRAGQRAASEARLRSAQRSAAG